MEHRSDGVAARLGHSEVPARVLRPEVDGGEAGDVGIRAVGLLVGGLVLGGHPGRRDRGNRIRIRRARGREGGRESEGPDQRGVRATDRGLAHQAACGRPRGKGPPRPRTLRDWPCNTASIDDALSRASSHAGRARGSEMSRSKSSAAASLSDAVPTSNSRLGAGLAIVRSWHPLSTDGLVAK